MSKFEERLRALIDLVDEQAEDEELWDTHTDCSQADALQKALRQLHDLIEGDIDL